MSEQNKSIPENIKCEVALPKVEAISLTANDAAELLGISASHFYNLHKSGRLGPTPIRLGRAVRWSRREILDWFDQGSPPRNRWLATRQFPKK